MTFRRVIAADELWIGEMRSVAVDGEDVLLVHTEEGVVALEDRCVHLGVQLSRGHLEGSELVCSAHGWRYDPRSGCGVNPERARLRRFAVRVEGGEVLVDVASVIQTRCSP